jgi:hypothetical protein
MPRTLQETHTSLSPDDVLAAARRYFVERNSLYPAFADKAGPTFVTFRGQGTEEIVIAVAPDAAGTRVTGSTYLFDQQLARFFTMLPPPTTPVQA